MAFNKRTWKGRQGTGLNKFSINGATPVPVVNQPDSVTEQGDALSAGNMNNLENRIYTAFEDEAMARDDADTALKAAIAKNTAEIENLKQTTKQDEQTVQYPDDGNYSSIMPDGVPERVAKYGIWERARGKSRGWNQLVPLDVLTTRDFGGFKITNNNDGSWTLNGTASSNIAEYLTGAINLPIGHKILFGYVNLGSAISGLLMRDQYSFAGTGSLMIWESSVATSAFAVMVDSGTVLNNVKIVPIVRDLTLIFPEGVPATVADCVKACPDLLKWDAYGYSLVDKTDTGVEAIGFNRWDEQTREGYYNSAGIYISDSGQLCTKNRIEVMPSTTYYYKNDGYQALGNVCFYDANGNFILRSDTAATFTTPANAKYINLSFGANYGATYNHDICINISGSLNGTYKPYVEPQTLMLSSPVTLKSAGSVAEVLTLETGKKTRPIATIDMKDMEYSATEGIFVTRLPNSKQSSDCGITTTGLTVAPWKSIVQMVDGDLVWSAYEDYYYIKDTSCTTAEEMRTKYNGWLINYELATPLSDEQVCDPIINNTIATEGGGTINTTQSQTPVIDNCLDVGYLTL